MGEEATDAGKVLKVVEPAKAKTDDELAEELRAAQAEKKAFKRQFAEAEGDGAWKIAGPFELKKPEPKPEPKKPIELLKDRSGRFWEEPKEEPRKEAPKAPKPVIELSAPEMGEAAKRAMVALRDRGAAIYQRDGALVRPVMDPTFDRFGKRILCVSSVRIDEPFLKSQLYEHIQFKKKSKEGPFFDTGPGTEITKLILGARGKWPFPILTGLLAAPTLRPDGSPLSGEGYDADTGLYLFNSPSVRIDRIGWADAKDSMEVLRELISEVAFVDLESRSVGLSFIQSSLLRGAIDVFPLHALTSPNTGHGKSEFVDMVCMIATGERCPVVAASCDPVEREKRIAIAARTGRAIISLDNITGPLESDLLSQLVTQQVVGHRQLHSNDEERITNRSVVSANGNNLVIVGDLTQRSLLAAIDAKMENASDRAFERDAVQTIMRNRAKYIRAALTITLWYLHEGMPDCPKGMNRFKRRSQLVRGALIALGERDPAATIQVVRESDPKLQASAAGLVAMVGLFGLGGRKLFMSQMIEATKSIASLREILDAPADAPMKLEPKQKALRDAFMEVAGEGKGISPEKLSTWLRGNKGRIVDGLRLCGEKDGHTKVLRWWVERAE